MSLDGFIAGPKPEPGGAARRRRGTTREWIVRLASWRKYHGLEGGETGADDELVERRPA